MLLTCPYCTVSDGNRPLTGAAALNGFSVHAAHVTLHSWMSPDEAKQNTPRSMPLSSNITKTQVKEQEWGRTFELLHCKVLHGTGSQEGGLFDLLDVRSVLAGQEL